MDLKVGDHIKALKLKRSRNYNTFPVDTQYTAENFEGKIIKIRDLSEDQLSIQTIERDPLNDRSRYLITIKTKNGLSSAYLGCLVEIEKIEKLEEHKKISAQSLEDDNRIKMLNDQIANHNQKIENFEDELAWLRSLEQRWYKLLGDTASTRAEKQL